MIKYCIDCGKELCYEDVSVDWAGTINGALPANIAEINGMPIANIAKVNGV